MNGLPQKNVVFLKAILSKLSKVIDRIDGIVSIMEKIEGLKNEFEGSEENNLSLDCS